MRAAWFLFLISVGCGGRTLGEAVDDEFPHAGGFGGFASAGAPGSGGFGAQSQGGSSSGGARSTGGSRTTGGFSNTGGSLTTGGKVGFGGSWTSGGTITHMGGASATGGRGSGGTTGIQVSCAKSCDRLLTLCNLNLGQMAVCTDTCTQQVTGATPECTAAQQKAVDCVNSALSIPGATCDAAPQILLIACGSELLSASDCGLLPFR